MICTSALVSLMFFMLTLCHRFRGEPELKGREINVKTYTDLENTQL